ncbi:MAG: hypothetical protein WBN68_11860 [Sedimenticolaceae bacterium]
MRRKKQQTRGVAVSSQVARAWLDADPVTAPPGGVKACRFAPDRQGWREARRVVAAARRSGM